MNQVVEELDPSRAVAFHGYKVFKDGTVIGKNGKPIKYNLRKRNGGGFCVRVALSINGKKENFTLHRLVAACFIGPVFGYQINHKDRNTMNNDASNLERVTPSQNQRHWRDCELGK